MKEQYDNAIQMLWRPDINEGETELAVDVVVRHGMFLDPEYVRGPILKLIAAASIYVRIELMDVLADYDVPLCADLFQVVRSRLAGGDMEFLTALMLLLRNTPVDTRRTFVEDLRCNGEITPDRLGLANRALVRLERE